MADARINSDDADSFLDALNSEEHSSADAFQPANLPKVNREDMRSAAGPAGISPAGPSSGRPDSNFVEIHAFLKRRTRRKKMSIRDVALAAYQKQMKSF